MKATVATRAVTTGLSTSVFAQTARPKDGSVETERIKTAVRNHLNNGKIKKATALLDKHDVKYGYKALSSLAPPLAVVC